jgi:hypothetical protein
MNVAGLRDALRQAGIRCEVEAEGKVAVVTPATSEDATDWPAMAERVVAMAREHGFANAALEVP